MKTPPPAKPFPPGEHIADELRERGWTVQDMAQYTCRTPEFIERLITGEERITRGTARRLAKAFGTSARVWLNLEANYRHNLKRLEGRDGSVHPL